MIEVGLTAREMAEAAHCGIDRQLKNEGNGRSNRGGMTKADQAKQSYGHERGAQAECAVAKAKNRYWPASTTYDPKAVDIAPDWQVRWTSYSDDPELIVELDANPDHVYVLVTGGVYRPDPSGDASKGRWWFKLHGFIRARDATLPSWKHDHHGTTTLAYWVPVSGLQAIEELQ